MTEQSVLLLVEICKIFLLKQFFKKLFFSITVAVIALSSSDEDFPS